MTAWNLTRGDQYPFITHYLVDDHGAVVDLTYAVGVVFQMGRPGFEAKVHAPAIVVNAAGGIVRYEWGVDDLDTAGAYNVQFKIEYADGSTRTLPVSLGGLLVIVHEGMIETVPVVLSVSPASGSRAGGVPITITGRSFNGATGVTVGGVAATSVVVVDRHTITAITPATSAGSKAVAVTSSGGTGSKVAAFTSVDVSPTLSSISPTTGELAGGITMTINGTLLDAILGVTVGGVACTGVTAISASQVTVTLPAMPAGALDVVVTTAGGSATLSGAFTAAYHPELFTLTGWWRSYAGAPWVGTVSAGSSGTHDLTAVSAPSVGAAQNGYSPASLDGVASALVSATAVSSFFAAGSGSIAILFKANVAAANNAGDAYLVPGLFTDTQAYFGMGFSDAGVRAYLYDSSYKQLTVACGTGAYHLAQMKWDGSTLKCRVDHGSWQSVAVGAIGTVTNTPVIGRTYNSSAFFNGDILEVAFAATALSDANFDYLRNYMNTRYGLAL